MRNKIYLVFFVLMGTAASVKAQTDFQKTDSISASYFNNSKWNELIDFGKLSLANGDDFPELRLRMGYAAIQLGNYSLALQNYRQVLKADRFNQAALYYSYLCNTYLNRAKEASFFVSKIEGKSVDGVYIKPNYLTQAGAETAVKFTDNFDRGNANFTRIYAQMRVGYQFYIDYSLLFYNQPIAVDQISQSGNYLKLSYMPVKDFSILWAWNYSATKFRFSSNKLNTLLLGLAYTRPYYRVQGDASLTSQLGSYTSQGNFQLLTYLTGNLNFYMSHRISYLINKETDSARSSSLIYSPTIGVKPFHNLWAEFSGTFGKQYNYGEADGLYQYNGLDPTKWKFSSNAYYLIKKHLLLSLGYTIEKKTDESLNFNYLQHSINAGITWNF
jgi:hypothetical protein